MAVIVQMILQLLAGIVVCFVVRRMGGALAGILSSAFFMLSPYMVGEAFVLSPAYLFLLIYSLVLLIIVLILPKNSGSPVWYILTGVFIGLVVYLDIFGVTLLLFLAGVFGLERECHERFRNSRIAVFLFGILGAAVGFWGAIGIDAIVSKKDFFKVLAAWAEIYCPQEIILPVMPGNISTLIEYGILFVILSMGIFSFWCRRTFERQGIWTLALIVFIPLQAFQMMQQNAGNEVYVYIFLTILAGVAVESIFLNENAEEKAMDVFQVLEKEAMEAEEKEMAKDMEKEKTDNNVDNDNKTETSEPPKVKFLENPLPLPKKHEPKVMDYKLTEENKENDFDLDVSDDDDFDI